MCVQAGLLKCVSVLNMCEFDCIEKQAIIKTIVWNQETSINWTNHSRCQPHLYRSKQSSCAQLAVSKLLGDLYRRNALAGNSSLSFILFVCVKFPLWPHPFSHPVPALSIHQRAHFVSADFILTAAITSEQGPTATRELFHLPSASPRSADGAPDVHGFLLHRQAKKH